MKKECKDIVEEFDVVVWDDGGNNLPYIVVGRKEQWFLYSVDADKYWYSGFYSKIGLQQMIDDKKVKIVGNVQ